MNETKEQAIIPMEEYKRLKAMEETLDTRRAEIEKNADKIALQWHEQGYWVPRYKFIGKGEALKILQEGWDATEATLQTVKKDLVEARISRVAEDTIFDRLRFLFTGEIRYRSLK